MLFERDAAPSHHRSTHAYHEPHRERRARLAKALTSKKAKKRANNPMHPEIPENRSQLTSRRFRRTRALLLSRSPAYHAPMHARIDREKGPGQPGKGITRRRLLIGGGAAVGLVVG
ncbi:MAG: hypothetical protein EOP21_08845, partial [Hyphomicrobiales bacterium]